MKRIFVALVVVCMFTMLSSYACADVRDKIVEGSLFYFGRYEQDNDLANGPEEIEWIVLDVDDNMILLISECGLDSRQFNDKHGVYEGPEITWGSSSLRRWLNDDFYSTAFDRDEQKAIMTTLVENDPEITKDKVFLLSRNEAYNIYFSNAKTILCVPTAYAIANGAEVEDGSRNKNNRGMAKWWLRSPGYSFQNAAIANDTRMAELRSGFFTSSNICVRPVIWVDLNSEIFAWNH